MFVNLIGGNLDKKPKKQKQTDRTVTDTTTPRHADFLTRSHMHEADCVLEERTRKGKPEYLVRWTGYDAEHDSWTTRITPGLQQQWAKTRRHRRWSRLLKASRIVKARGPRARKEYLVKFCGFRELEWTPFVSAGLLRAWQRKLGRCRSRGFS